MAATFFALLKIADIAGKTSKPLASSSNVASEEDHADRPQRREKSMRGPTFHYNIQVHLPATKDTEVYNAIFKSMRDHFVDI